MFAFAWSIPFAFPTGGIFVTTPDVNENAATIHIETTAENSTADKKSYLLQAEIITPDGKTIALRALGGSITPKALHSIAQDVKIAKPALMVARFSGAL